MEIKASIFMAMSLDGFIARPDGSIDWLTQANARVPVGEDCGYQTFINSVDVLVMGHNTYQQVLSWDEWPYGQKLVIVLSRGSLEIPSHLADTVSASAETPAELMWRLSAQGVGHLYIDGGITVQRFLAAGLIDEMTITVIPVLLGEGKPLFSRLESDVSLRHLHTKTFDFGFVQVKYRVENKRLLEGE